MLAPARTAVRLALADAVHEWRMSLCLILAVAAIAAPLLLFFGLKYGTVDTLRKRLLNNPATLELLPVTEKLLDAVWFETRRADPRVAFLVPHTRKLSAQADVVPAGGGATKRLDLHPSLPGDTLLSRFGLEAPAADTCVLTSLAAERLNAKTGDRLAFTVTREQGRSQASHTFEVRGVLPARAGSLAAAYIPLDQLEAVEDYKDGRAVPAFGWPGNDPVAHSVAQAVLLAVPVELDARQRASVQLNTGFTGLEELGRAPLTQAGLPAQLPGAFVYRLRCVGRGATQDNLLALRDKLRGLEAICVPLFGRMTATLPDGETLALTPVSGQESPALREALNNAAPLEQWTDFARRAAPRVLLVPPSKQAGAEALVTVSLPDSEGTELRFRVALAAHPDVPPGTAFAPQALLGQLSLLGDRALTDGTDSSGNPAFLLGRRGYSSFRMYAARLDDVAPLARSLEAEDIRVTTRADRIEEIKRLDAGLSLLFWLIAAASSVGGTACLLSSIYANVERKRKDFAVLRLLGLHGAGLGLFPLTSSLALTLCGMLLSLALFHGMALTINILFAEHLDAGEAFCTLGLPEQGTAVLVAAGLAVLAGIAAAARLASVQPAESLRDE